jgi:hypothetical protein
MTFSGVNPDATNPRVPMIAAKFADESEIRDKSDISRAMKFARDNDDWEYHISLASTFDGSNAITVSYKASLEECEDSKNWYWTAFCACLDADGMVGLPARTRTDFDFDRKCFIGDHCLHTILFEKKASTGVKAVTTECDGPPCFYAYCPNSVMKFRAESADIVKRMITMCYNMEPTTFDIIPGKFWGLIARVDGGEIPYQCTAERTKDLNLDTAIAYNREILSNGLASSSYRSGTGKFAAAFKPGKPYSATIAIEPGIFGEHGVAILFEQKAGRCLITQRLTGFSDEDAFWQTMRLWAKFEPRQAFPRRDAGQLYYPAAYSHMFEQHWDFIHRPLQEYAPSIPAGHYASDAARLVFSCDALVDAEAPDRSSRVAQSGAISRKFPIQDAQNYWSTPQEQAQEECDTVLYGFAPKPDSHNVGTGLGDSV